MFRALALATAVSAMALVAPTFKQGGANLRPAPVASRTEPAPGQLSIVQKGEVGALCPLERTSVNALVSGFGADVRVTQTFHNPTNETIEAIYTFPLPNEAAVNRMTMRIGDRVVQGEMKRREQARRIYEAAKAQGQGAALLDQERPNIFTQSVANITPGATVQIEIGYVQTLKYQDGTFEFNFPMVVGPRYLGNAPDPGKIAPPITPKGTRTGTNVDLTVNIDAGARIYDLQSVLHVIDTKKQDASHVQVKLAKRDEIPNRDFILRYQVAADEVTDSFVSHMDGDKGGFFAMALLPPKSPKEEDATPREVIFVMDQSGSQQGFPIEKSKELTLKLIETLRPDDTFNVMGFNTSVRALWPSPQPVNEKTLGMAREFVQGMDANGGTHIREGVVAALEGQADPKRLRMVVFNTDGYVGDEKLILDTIQKTRGTARMFVFGIGNAVNRFLIDSMASEGRGAAEYVTLADEADKAVGRFLKRTRTPVLTDVSVEFEGVQIDGMEPQYLPDVFDEAPVYVFGRYVEPGKAKIRVKGKHRGQPWSKTLDVNLPMNNQAPAVASLWARNRVDSLTRENWAGQFNGEGKNLAEEITQVALDFGIMTEYTSFVAVEERIVNVGGKQRRVHVPVEMADGVSYEGTGLADLVGSGNASRNTVSKARLGGGGFGGGGGGAPAAPASAGKTLPANIQQITYDPTDNTIVANLKPENKIDKHLTGRKGKLEVQVWLAIYDDKTLKALADKGLKIDVKDARLRIVFGTVDAAKLLDIAKLAAVQRIEPLEE